MLLNYLSTIEPQKFLLRASNARCMSRAKQTQSIQTSYIDIAKYLALQKWCPYNKLLSARSFVELQLLFAKKLNQRLLVFKYKLILENLGTIFCRVNVQFQYLHSCIYLCQTDKGQICAEIFLTSFSTQGHQNVACGGLMRHLASRFVF